MENFELTLDWTNRDLLLILLGSLSGFLVFVIGRRFARFTTRYASRSMERAYTDFFLTIRFLQTLIYIGLVGAVLIAALKPAGLHTTSLTAMLASVGLAIGMVLKNSLFTRAIGCLRDGYMGRPPDERRRPIIKIQKINTALTP